MPITDLLERNSKLYGEEIALVEINPEIQEAQRVTWKEGKSAAKKFYGKFRIPCLTLTL